MSRDSSLFAWPNYPTNETEFESLMKAMDGHLEAKGLKPFQRPLHVPKLLWEAFSWEGKVLPSKDLASKAGYRGDILMAKSYRWYEDVYGEKLKSDWAIGYIPLKIAHGVWKVRLPVFYGRCSFFADRDINNKNLSVKNSSVGPPAVNILSLIENVTEGLLERLTDTEITWLLEFYIFALRALMWWESLPSTTFFDEARRDYSSSTDELLKHNFAQSRWASAQSVEKTLKGLLSIAGKDFPKGRDGHDLVQLGVLMEKELGASISREVLSLAQCSPKVRYGEESSNEQQSLIANHAVIELLSCLANSTKVNDLVQHRHSR